MRLFIKINKAIVDIRLYPGAAPGEFDETTSFWFCPTGAIMWQHNVIFLKTKLQCSALFSAPCDINEYPVV